MNQTLSARAEGIMAGFEVWLLGYAGTKALDRLLIMVRGDPFIRSLHKEIEIWANELPDGAILGSTNALFPSHIPDELLDKRPQLLRLRASFQKSLIPSEEQWRVALFEQWNAVRETGPGLQEFFNLEEDVAAAHISALAKRLDTVCVKQEDLFKVSIMSLVRDIQEQLTKFPKETEATLDNLEDDHIKLIARISQYEGLCAIRRAPGEYECLWVPGQAMDMQWGWERTPAEVELSGKPRGSRIERMHWIGVVTTLVGFGVLEQTPDDNTAYKLTQLGWKFARQIKART